MIKAIVFDFSRVLLDAKDSGYSDSLNALHNRLSQTDGYNPLDHFDLNQPLLDFALGLKEKYDLYIFTTGLIQDDPSFKTFLDSIFKKVFTVEEVGHMKFDKQAYNILAEMINQKPEEILFIDDTEENITAAKNTGFPTIHFVSTSQAIKDITHALQAK